MWCNQINKDMSSVKVMRTVQSENRPSFNEWCQELKVSSGYYVVGQKDVNGNYVNRPNEVKQPQTYEPLKEESFWGKIFRSLGL